MIFKFYGETMTTNQDLQDLKQRQSSVLIESKDICKFFFLIILDLIICPDVLSSDYQLGFV